MLARNFFQEIGRATRSCSLSQLYLIKSSSLGRLSFPSTPHLFISQNFVKMSDGKDSSPKKENKKATPKTQEESTNKESTSSATPLRYATRGNVLTEQEKHVQERKDAILSLSLSKKRKLYHCKDKYTELMNVQTWPEYFSEELVNDPHTKTWWKRNSNNVVSEMNEDLNVKLSIFRGDITTLEIDAIVNAANESLLGGGGVDGAIHRAAGIDLRHECELLNGCQPGDAKISCGYKLPAKYVIHTVGPRGERPEVLANCYKTSLDLLRDNELKSVAFPCISTGIFGYPNLNAAKVALKTIRDWLETEEYASKIERILFCLFLEKDVVIYNEQMQLFFPLNREAPEGEKGSAL